MPREEASRYLGCIDVISTALLRRSAERGRQRCYWLNISTSSFNWGGEGRSKRCLSEKPIAVRIPLTYSDAHANEF